MREVVINTILLYVCRSKEWTGDYSTDYQELLPGAVTHPNSHHYYVSEVLPIGYKAYFSQYGPWN